MPYATNDGINIYYEREGSGPPLILHHGYTMAIQDWRDDGYVAALRDDYELILMDPRGHGNSDKPHNVAAYTFDTRVADVTAVLDHAGVERAIFWGYSMGGHVGYAIARYAPHRFHALIIGGSHPYARDAEVSHALAASMRAGGIADFVTNFMERNWGPLPPEQRVRVLANDSEALAPDRIAMGEAPSFAADVAQLRIPILLYAGDRDQPTYDEARRGATEMPHVRFVSLPGCNHMQAVWQSDTVLSHVRAFLTSVAIARNATA